MAAPIVFAVYDGAGAPETGLSLTMSKYMDRSGVNRSAPSIVELGGGLYGFTPTDNDVAIGTAFATADTANHPRFFSGAIHTPSDPFVAFFVEGTGTVAFDTYCDLEGNARTPPSIVDLQAAGLLYCFTPSAADLEIGVAFEIDTGNGANVPARMSGYLDPVVAVTSVVIPDGGVADFGSLGSTALGKARDLGRDIMTDPDTGDLILSGGDLVIVANIAAIRQEAEIRMRFMLGEWFLDTSQGVPHLQTILVKSPDLAAIEGVLKNAILETAGIDEITKLTLTYDAGERTLSVVWSAKTNLGELIPATQTELF